MQELWDSGQAWQGKDWQVRGWVRTLRAQKTFAFLEVNDGSCMTGVQVVVNESAEGHQLIADSRITTGCAVSARGKLVESPGGKQGLELQASVLELIGTCSTSREPVMSRHAVDAKADTFIPLLGLAVSELQPQVYAGECSSSDYPLQKKRHSLEFLRSIAHLRPRTNIIGAIMRVRSALAQATHAFFSQHGFLYVHTPIISTADCEGAGEMFQVRAADQ